MSALIEWTLDRALLYVRVRASVKVDPHAASPAILFNDLYRIDLGDRLSRSTKEEEGL